jgi:hypothetical protein
MNPTRTITRATPTVTTVKGNSDRVRSRNIPLTSQRITPTSFSGTTKQLLEKLDNFGAELLLHHFSCEVLQTRKKDTPPIPSLKEK